MYNIFYHYRIIYLIEKRFYFCFCFCFCFFFFFDNRNESQIDTKEMVLHAMMSYGSMRELELILCAAWAIWKNRNNLLHDENVLWTHQNIYGRWWKVTRVWFLKWYRRRIINRADLAILTWGPNYDNDTTIKKNTKNIRTYYSNLLIYKNCKNSICNDPKLVLGSNVKGPNNKFVERGCQRTRLTSKEKRVNLMFIDGLALI